MPEGPVSDGPRESVPSRAPRRAPQVFPLWMLATLGVITSWLGRGLEPALPGSMTGIERWIFATQQITGALSQLCAVGAVMLVLRMSGLLLIERRLGLGFRTIALPAATAVAALCVAAAHDGLDASMQAVLAIACILTVALTIPFGLVHQRTRAIALLSMLAIAASAFHFGALELAIRAGEAASSFGYELSRGFSTASYLTELGMLSFTIVWLGAPSPIRISVYGLVCLLFAMLVTVLARAGLEPDASAATVVVARVMDALARPPAPYVPQAMRHALAAATGIAALLCLGQWRRASLGALFALCLTGAGAVDVPLSGLLICAGALILPWLALTATEAPEVAEGAVTSAE